MQMYVALVRPYADIARCPFDLKPSPAQPITSGLGEFARRPV